MKYAIVAEFLVVINMPLIHIHTMTKRSINKARLRAGVKQMGLERMAVAAECSASLLQKLVSEGYDTVPSIHIIDGLCSANECTIDDLFPRVAISKEEIA